MEYLVAFTNGLSVLVPPWEWPKYIERSEHWGTAPLILFFVINGIEWALVIGIVSAVTYYYFRDRGASAYPHHRIFLHKLPILIGLSMMMVIPHYFIGGNLNDHMFGMIGVIFYFLCAAGGAAVAAVGINYFFVKAYRNGEFTLRCFFRSAMDGIFIVAASFGWIAILAKLKIFR